MPRDQLQRVKEAAQRQSIRAVQVLTEIMDDTFQAGNVRLAAANAILDRAIGKPTQQTDHISSDGSMTPKGMDAFYAHMHGTEKPEKRERDLLN